MKRRLRVKKKTLFIIITILVLTFILVSPFIFIRIKLIGDKSIVINYKDKYSESGYKLNLFGKDLTEEVKVIDNIKEELGSYKVTYTYKFLFYKLSTTRKVEVKDIKGPKIELLGGSTVDVVINEHYKEQGYKAIDNKDGDVTETVKVTGEIDTSKLGVYNLTYEVTDSSGNKSTVKRNVNVVLKNPTQMSIAEYSLDGWYDDVKLKETENRGDSYFNSLIIVGDSNIMNMYEYGHIKAGNAWALPCLHAESIHYQNLNIYGTNKVMTLLDAIKNYKSERIILNFGSFSSLWISEDVFISQASSMIEKIQEVSPNTQIILISIYPVTKNGINNDNFSQSAINKCNFRLLELANKYKLKFLDVQTVLKDSSGYGNPNYYIQDGFHLTSYGHSIVREYIKTHGA